MPRVNYLLLTGVLLLVFMFRSSGELAAAYVLAVATTALAAGLLGFIVIWKGWKWRLWTTAALMVPLLVADSSFVIASLLKLFEGAWLPVLVGAMLILIMTTWRRGTRLLSLKTRRVEVPFEPLVKSLEERPPYIAPVPPCSPRATPVCPDRTAAQPQAQQGAAARRPDHRQRRHPRVAVMIAFSWSRSATIHAAHSAFRFHGRPTCRRRCARAQLAIRHCRRRSSCRAVGEAGSRSGCRLGKTGSISSSRTMPTTLELPAPEIEWSRSARRSRVASRASTH
jgi:hypothetical protein